MNIVLPHQRQLVSATGILEPAQLIERRLSDMAAYYADQDEVPRLLRENPLIYQVYNAPIPEEDGQLCHCTTVIKPGRVGREYFMTKGHHHEIDAAETYYFLSGEGCLVLESRQGESRTLAVGPGSVGYIPPGWAHRTVNTGDSELVFFAVWPGNAGHDYESIEGRGFRVRILAGPDGPQVHPVRG